MQLDAINKKCARTMQSVNDVAKEQLHMCSCVSVERGMRQLP